MTSVQVKKGEKGATEEDRQKLLKQMKVRTTLKKDKSWIHQQNSEDEKDEIPSPTSPQLKSLEGRKSLWSPKPDTKTERNSGTFTAKEIITSSSSPPVQSINKRFSYSTNETSSSTSTTSQPSPPPSTTGNKQASSYIIRGQPFNAVSQVKSPPTYNGYQKSTVQARTTSLPRVPTATGYKMSTDEYKKLAPYNIRNKSADLSDEETPFTPQEQVKRTEQASGILRNTSSKDRSYVISAAKRNSGHIPQDTPSPFMAKRVEIIEGENTANRKSQTLPKSLSSYLYDDANRFENNWKETQSKQTPSQTSPLRTSERSSSPQMTSYSTSSTSETRSSSVTPEPGKITVVREESHRDNKEAPKPAAQKETATRRTAGTRTERVETTGNKSESLPEFLASYLYDDVSRFEKNWQENQLKQSTSQTSPPRVIDRPESPKVTLWSANTETSSSVKPEPGKITVLKEESDKSPPKTTTTRTVTTRTESGNSNPAIPILNMYSDVTESKSSSRQSGTGKITVLREDSDKSPPKTTTTRTVTTRTESGNSNPAIPILNMYSDVTESKSSSRQSGTGKITVLREDSMKDVTDIPNLTSSTISTSVTESTKPGLQAGQGKITHIKIESEPDRRSVPSRSSEITTTTTRTTVTTEIRNESTPPKPVPRMEAKPKDTPVASSGPQPDLISWSDLDDITVAKEKTTTPTPVPRHTNKDSEKPSLEPPLIVISPELKSNRPNQPLTPGAINTANESRYRVSETLDEPVLNPKNTQLISDSGNRSVTSTTTETRSERSRTPELPKSERSSSPRPTPRPRENTTTTVTESRYRVPDTLEDTMLESSPSRSSSRTTVTTTRSADPIYTEYLEEVDPRSRRTISSSTEKITTSSTLETHLENTTSREASQYDPQSSSNKGVLFVKEYVNTSESLKSPTTTGSLPNFSDDSERLSYSSSSSYLYSSAPKRSDEGPCTYCGREIKDCAKIILEHLNIYCHEYCFKCGICHKPMGDLIDNLFIHRDVVHCESCYDKLF